MPSTVQAMTRIVLIRHGEAQSHVDGIVGGATGCTGLSDLGRRQVGALRDRLARTGELGPVAALYASTLPRAIETAEIIAPAVGDRPIALEQDLREFDPGEADGMTWQEYQDRYPPPAVRDPYRPRTPGSESWTLTVAGSAFGNRSTPRSRKEKMPSTTNDITSMVANTGRRTQSSDNTKKSPFSAGRRPVGRRSRSRRPSPPPVLRP